MMRCVLAVGKTGGKRFFWWLEVTRHSADYLELSTVLVGREYGYIFKHNADWLQVFFKVKQENTTNFIGKTKRKRFTLKRGSSVSSLEERLR